MLLQVFYIRVAAQEPEQFVNDGLEVQFLRRQERKALLEVETSLSTKNGMSAGAGAVRAVLAFVKDEFQQLQVLDHSRAGYLAISTCTLLRLRMVPSRNDHSARAFW